MTGESSAVVEPTRHGRAVEHKMLGALNSEFPGVVWIGKVLPARTL